MMTKNFNYYHNRERIRQLVEKTAIMLEPKGVAIISRFLKLDRRTIKFHLKAILSEQHCKAKKS
jgi:hypothetical protein